MNRFSRMSGRRKALLAMVLAMLAVVAGMGWAGVAGFSGTAPEQMDWNGDGQVTRGEILQGYTVVVVEETAEGQRVCRRYAPLRDRSQTLRVDCRTELGAAAGDNGG